MALAKVTKFCWGGLVLLLIALLVTRITSSVSESDVLDLDESNFDEEIKKHDFILVEFFAPWCGHCKNLAPEYEKAATALKDHDPKIVLAKVDANEEKNKKIASDNGVKGFPTLKIFRNGGSIVEEYKGPREAAGIVSYLKKQSGPATSELKTAEEAGEFLVQNKLAIIGLFKSFESDEFEKFNSVAQQLRSEFDFRHTLDSSVLDEPLSAPAVRLFKSFDERFVDFTTFDVEELKKLIEDSSVPLVSELSQDPEMQPFLMKFFETEATKGYLFVNENDAEEHRAAFKKIAETYRPKSMFFLAINAKENSHALQHFGISAEKVPSIVIQDVKGVKYASESVEASDLASFMEEFMAGNVKPWVKSEPAPEKNDEPVKVVVRSTLNELVLDSGKDVLLEFYAPWCGHCKKLAPILEEVGVHFESDPSVVIAKLDATANDLPDDIFEVSGFPTIVMYTSGKELVKYDGNRSKEDFITFIEKHRSSAPVVVAVGGESDESEGKDEL